MDKEMSLPTRPTFESKLPRELLLEIFEHVQEDCKDIEEMSKLLIGLMQVCSFWHNSIMDSPQLWSNIYITELGFKWSTATLRLINTFLRISKSYPLSIQIVFTCYGSQDCPPLALKFMELSYHLRLHAKRIAAFTLVAPSFLPIQNLLHSLVGVSMPILKYWRVWALHGAVRGARNAALHPMLVQPQYLSGTPEPLYPNLKRVSLSAALLPWSEFSPSNLTELEIRFLPADQRLSTPTILTILHANSSTLELLNLSGVISADEFPTSEVETIMLPNLHTLLLGFGVIASELIPFLTSVRTPNLKTLSLNDVRWAKHAFDFAIIHLFHAILNHLPLPQISQLYLHNIAFCPSMDSSIPVLDVLQGQSIGATTAVEFFCSLENLITLTLDSPDQATFDGLDRAQTKVPCSKIPVPRMKHLNIMNAGFRMLNSFLQGRLDSPNAYPTLDTLTLTMPMEWIHMFRRPEIVDMGSVAKKINISSNFLPRPAVVKLMLQ